MLLDCVYMAQDTDNGGPCRHTSGTVGCIRCR